MDGIEAIAAYQAMMSFVRPYIEGEVRARMALDELNRLYEALLLENAQLRERFRQPE